MLDAAMKAIPALGIMGVNITIPYKEAVIPYLDELSPEAAQIGSVNTIVYRDGRLVGHSTDGRGFILALERETTRSVSGKSVCLIGAGGSARSIAFALADAGISELWISNRTRFRADALKHDIQCHHPRLKITCVDERAADLDEILHARDIVINTTPIGMSPNIDAMPLSNLGWISDHHLICDIIYKPQPTRWLTEAQLRGASILGGAGMLAGQGILAFHLFTGLEVSYDVMRNEV
jgi:shikimate dehydrogenase